MTISTQMKRFYVYLYLREDGTPYYVGKGKGKRAFCPYGHHAPPPPKERIQFVATDMSEPDALQGEMLLIQLYGRKDNKTGILRNLTDGGEGCSGHIKSEESRAKLSIKLKGRIRTSEHCRRLSIARRAAGIRLSAERKQQMSQMFKNRVFSAEHRRRISEGVRADLEVHTHRGAKNGRAIIGLDEVRQIRNKLCNEKQAKALWGLSRTQFYRIKRGEQWTIAAV